jgi:hypothetical protein
MEATDRRVKSAEEGYPEISSDPDFGLHIGALISNMAHRG